MKSFISSLGFAFNGIRKCFSKESHFKVHSFCTVLIIIAGYFFKLAASEWVVISLSIASVFAAELFNTSIEILCNVVNSEIHPQIKLVKDMAAGAVLVMAVSAIVCGAIIFIPKIIQFITQ